MVSPGHGEYIVVDGFNIWWDPQHPENIHLTLNDRAFTDERGERPGLWLVVSRNPRSANYNPAAFNRCARALAAADKPAPPADAPELSRKLRDRRAVEVELGL